jgi:hypothetical protein
MARISATGVSGTLERAWRAALLLTGSAEMAEIAVLKGIASVGLCDDLEKVLVANTVEFVMRRPGYEDRVKHALARQSHDELRRLVYLTPEARDSLLLPVLFGIPYRRCAAILNLSIREFQASLSAALGRLAGLEHSGRVAGSNTANTGE